MGRRRGFFAELERIGREAERRERRRQRELAQQQRAEARFEKLAQKERELAEARYQVAAYENQMELLTSVHREASPPISGNSIAASTPPAPPPLVTSLSSSAAARLETYKPSFFAKLLGLDVKARRKLEEGLHDALEIEATRRAEQEQHYERTVRDWEETVALARQVVAKSPDAYQEVLRESGCLDELTELGCRPTVSWLDGDVGMVAMSVDGSEVVPHEIKSLSKAGKLSVKNMPKAQFWETYQDFVCGAALRAGREILAVVPVESVLVNVSTRRIDPATGQPEEATILSVYCVRDR